MTNTSTHFSITRHALIAVALSLALPACSTTEDGGSSAGDQELSIEGEWLDQYMTTHMVDENTWETSDDYGASALYLIEFIDEEGEYVVAQNDSGNEYYAGLYSRFDWMWDGDALFYCQTAFDAESADAADSASGSDRGDPATGCSGFSWTHMNP
jgi:hypothetical protein